MSHHPANLAIRFWNSSLYIPSAVGVGFRPKACYAEIIFFGFAVWGLFDTGATLWAWIFGGITLVHYMISYDRIGWLLKQ